MNAGIPYFWDRESRVATLTSIVPSHSSLLWVGDVLADSYHSLERVLSVGSEQTFIVATPGSLPTAQFSIIRSLRLAINSSRSQQMGFGSIATTRAPRVWKASEYTPMFAPTSKTRS